ncbi:MAG: hypothetical protein KatS3mg035_1687 [Bacteroidia bacterium]|nr:MAG: hypothetical protein KatS3mg035_1687 [Bacteroidia bacterium]
MLWAQIKSTINVQGDDLRDIVKKQLKIVLRDEKGVLQVNVILESAEALVTFDDAQTSLEALKKSHKRFRNL